jgi:hypothetical protein
LEQNLLFKKKLNARTPLQPLIVSSKWKKMGRVYKERGCVMLIFKWKNVENYKLNN